MSSSSGLRKPSTASRARSADNLFVARLSKSGQLDYTSAGHPPALLLRQNGFEPINTDFITYDRVITGQWKE